MYSVCVMINTTSIVQIIDTVRSYMNIYPVLYSHNITEIFYIYNIYILYPTGHRDLYKHLEMHPIKNRVLTKTFLCGIKLLILSCITSFSRNAVYYRKIVKTIYFNRNLCACFYLLYALLNCDDKLLFVK